jgi:hypothetical protein
VVIGAPLDDHPFGIFLIPDGGSAYVFVKPGNGWAFSLNESAKLRTSAGFSASFGAHFSHSIGVSGDTVVGGAPFQDVGGDTDQGQAYVFVKPGSGWAGSLTQAATLNTPFGQPNDRAGFSVAVSGDTVFVGVPGEDVISLPDVGGAYAFVEPQGGWTGTPTFAARLSASDGESLDAFGLQASASGTRVMFSSDVNNATFYYFVRPSGGWAGALSQTEKLSSLDGSLQFIALGGNTLVAEATISNYANVWVRTFVVIFFNPKLLSGRVFNSGSMIPVEFRLEGEDGAPISDAEAEAMAAGCEARVLFFRRAPLARLRDLRSRRKGVHLQPEVAQRARTGDPTESRSKCSWKEARGRPSPWT